MKLNNQKRVAASILKASPKRVKFKQEALDNIKESITKADLKIAIKKKEITLKKKKGVSRARANKILVQKRKGRQKGLGSRKGKKTARSPKKENWMSKVRIQRSFIHELRAKKIITKKSYRMLYLRIKGGFFRSRNHIKLYISEQGLSQKNGKK